MAQESAPSGVRLSDYALLLRRQWVAVLLGILVGCAVAGGFLAVTPREYTADTSVLVTAPTDDTAPGSNRSPINLDTEARLVTSTSTVSDAAELLGTSLEDTEELADRVTVTVPPNTEILTIAFVAPSAEEARRGAEVFAQAYLDSRRATAEEALDAEFDALQARIDTVEEQQREVAAAAAALPAGSPDRARAEAQAAALDTQLANLGAQQNQVRSEALSPGRVVTQAVLPSSPSSPNIPVFLAMGLALGLLLGVGLAALRHRADDCIRTDEDLLRRTGLPVLGRLEGPLHADAGVLAATGPTARAHLRLRNVVTAALQRNNWRVVLVAGVRDGGSVAVNLATSLARAGEDVVLVCADTAADSAATLLGRDLGSGLSEVLAGQEQADHALRRLPGIPSLRVLGPGCDPDRIGALLGTRAPRGLVDRLLASSPYVVVEAPPTTAGPDAQTLADVADLVVVVIELDRTRAGEVADAVHQFEAMDRPVLGAVVVPAAPRGEGRQRASRPAARGTVASPGSAAPAAGRPGPADSGRAPALAPPAGSRVPGL